MKLVIRVLQVCDWLSVVRDALLEGLLRLLCVPCTDARDARCWSGWRKTAVRSARKGKGEPDCQKPEASAISKRDVYKRASVIPMRVDFMYLRKCVQRLERRLSG